MRGKKSKLTVGETPVADSMEPKAPAPQVLCERCGERSGVHDYMIRENRALGMANRRLMAENGELRGQKQMLQFKLEINGAARESKIRRQARAIRALEKKLLARGQEPYEDAQLADVSPVPRGE